MSETDRNTGFEIYEVLLAENHRQRAALTAIRELLGYAANEGKSLSVKESNANQAWHRADSALLGIPTGAASCNHWPGQKRCGVCGMGLNGVVGTGKQP